MIGRSRKDVLKAAFDQTVAFSPPVPPPNAGRVPSGAIRAMGLSLGRLSEDAARAEALAQQLASGETLHELDPGLIEPSFVEDRIDRTDDPDFRRLVDSIAQTGQQVPILVRPHPKMTGHYQVAYGHRRLNACRELARKVIALVRGLSDIELVVAQGKENAERRALSFIERAMFAAHLEQQGFERATIQAALAVHPAEMTRLLQVARSVPGEFVVAIGPAPRAGRPRWMELAALLERSGSAATLRALADQPSFRRLTSDARFERVMERLRVASTDTETAVVLRDRMGRPVIKAEHHNTGFRLLVDLRVAPGLDKLLLEKLPDLLSAFPAEQPG